MRTPCCTAFLGVLLCTVVQVGAQASLPAIENTLILGARASRQSSTQAPLESTLRSGARITVRAQDIHDYATSIVRSAVAGQTSSPKELGLLFVLRVREIKPISKTQSTAPYSPVTCCKCLLAMWLSTRA